MTRLTDRLARALEWFFSPVSYDRTSNSDFNMPKRRTPPARWVLPLIGVLMGALFAGRALRERRGA